MYKQVVSSFDRKYTAKLQNKRLYLRNGKFWHETTEPFREVTYNINPDPVLKKFDRWKAENNFYSYQAALIVGVSEGRISQLRKIPEYNKENVSAVVQLALYFGVALKKVIFTDAANFTR